MAQESPDALSARSILPTAARVIMINVDELPALEQLVAHTAGVLLRIQKTAELLLSQPVARNPVLSVGLPSRFR
jgi:hypothetical protein